MTNHSNTQPARRPVTRGWPPARRKAQAERIRAAKPWLRSTGPRSTDGKRRTRYNACKHNMRSAAMGRLRQAMRRQRRFLADFIARSNDFFSKERKALLRKGRKSNLCGQPRQKSVEIAGNKAIALDRLVSPLYLERRI